MISPCEKVLLIKASVAQSNPHWRQTPQEAQFPADRRVQANTREIMSMCVSSLNEREETIITTGTSNQVVADPDTLVLR